MKYRTLAIRLAKWGLAFAVLAFAFSAGRDYEYDVGGSFLRRDFADDPGGYGSFETMPRSLISGGLYESYMRIERQPDHPRWYADAIHFCGMLGAKREGARVLREATERGVADKRVQEVARMWGIQKTDEFAQ